MGRVRFDDFFEEVPDPALVCVNPDATKRVVKMDLVRELAKGRIVGDDELASAIALTRVMRAEYEAFGTNDKMVTLSEEDAREALRSLRLCPPASSHPLPPAVERLLLVQVSLARP